VPDKYVLITAFLPLSIADSHAALYENRAKWDTLVSQNLRILGIIFREVFTFFTINVAVLFSLVSMGKLELTSEEKKYGKRVYSCVVTLALS